MWTAASLFKECVKHWVKWCDTRLQVAVWWGKRSDRGKAMQVDQLLWRVLALRCDGSRAVLKNWGNSPSSCDEGNCGVFFCGRVCRRLEQQVRCHCSEGFLIGYWVTIPIRIVVRSTSKRNGVENPISQRKVGSIPCECSDGVDVVGDILHLNPNDRTKSCLCENSKKKGRGGLLMRLRMSDLGKTKYIALSTLAHGASALSTLTKKGGLLGCGVYYML